MRKTGEETLLHIGLQLESLRQVVRLTFIVVVVDLPLLRLRIASFEKQKDDDQNNPQR